MKTINIYLDKELVDRWGEDSWNKSPIFKTFIVDDEEDLWGNPIVINGKFYSVCRRQDENYAIVELDFYKCDEDTEELEEINEDNIKCPVCGFEESDCWEYNDNEEEEHECQNCGSILSWSREYSVTYTTTVKKINSVKKLQ